MLGAVYLVLDLRMMFSWIWYHSFSLVHLVVEKENNTRHNSHTTVISSLYNNNQRKEKRKFSVKLSGSSLKLRS